jgi:hypothetical protein
MGIVLWEFQSIRYGTISFVWRLGVGDRLQRRGERELFGYMVASCQLFGAADAKGYPIPRNKYCVILNSTYSVRFLSELVPVSISTVAPWESPHLLRYAGFRKPRHYAR